LVQETQVRSGFCTGQTIASGTGGR